MTPSFAMAVPVYAADATGVSTAVSAAEAGPVVRLVLLILIVMSVATWAILVAKIWRRKQLDRSDDRFLAAFYRSRRLREIADAAAGESASGPAQLFGAVYEEVESVRTHARSGAPLPDVGTLIRLAERALDRAVSEIRVDRERYLTFLASVASGAPFIGLFGTVWGIMNAFEGIGRMGSASLAVVAPGISEALIATAVGLAAAIPAALIYNYFQRRMDQEEVRLMGFRLELLNLLEAYVFPGLGDSTYDGTLEEGNYDGDGRGTA